MSEYRDEFPCTNCILIAKCISNIPTTDKVGYEDLENDPYLFEQYINELMTDCQLMMDYIMTGDYYDVGRRPRRAKAADFYRLGYKHNFSKTPL